MGKGSARRPTRLTQKELQERWEETFGTVKPDSKENT